MEYNILIDGLRNEQHITQSNTLLSVSRSIMGNILFGRLLKIDGVHTFIIVCALYIWSVYELYVYRGM